jgi:hypothetical protein
LTEKDVIDIHDNEIKNGQNDLTAQKDIKRLTESYLKTFSDSERKYLWRMFLTYSSDNVFFIIYLLILR